MYAPFNKKLTTIDKQVESYYNNSEAVRSMLNLVIWNAAVFAVYGFDKYNAMNGRRRVSERTLLCFAFLLGGFGAFLGMQIFRHKTKHIIFNIGVPLAMLVNVVCIYFARRGGFI